MGAYFFTQCKRLLRYLPGAFLVALLLMAGTALAFGALQESNLRDNMQKASVAIVGDTDNEFLQMGLSTLKAFDSTRLSLELHYMQQDEAWRALSAGQIAGFVVIPEGFVEEAFRGNILQLEFVSTAGATGLVSIFKEEITRSISDLLVSSQKGVFGMAEVMTDQGFSHRLSGKLDEMSVLYLDYVFTRDRIFSLETLGVAGSADLTTYLLCGFTILLSMLVCLSFAPALTCKSSALGQALCARGRSAAGQSLCDLLAYGCMTALVLFPILIAATCLGGCQLSTHALLGFIPIWLVITCFSFMMCSLSSQLIGGVLLQFFCVLLLGFLSGCMYPLYFFPLSMQQLAAWLPPALSRTQLANILTGTSNPVVLWLLIYSFAFAGLGCLLRGRRIKGGTPV